MALYHGDYLPDEPYEDWAIAERERLSGLYLDLLERQAEISADLGDFSTAIQICHQVLQRDACREAIYQKLMRYHYLAGDRAAALAIFDRCRQVLADELEVEPLPETCELRQAIVNDSLDHGQPHPVVPLRVFDPFPAMKTPFVGRQPELATLHRAWEKALAGRPQFVLIRGEAGVGKSRLLAEFRAQLTTDNVRVLYVRSYEMERNLAYRPVLELLKKYLPHWLRDEALELLRPFLSVVALLLPEIPTLAPHALAGPSLSPDQERQRMREGLARCLILAAERQPAMFMFDDLHWADPSTLDLLQYAVCRGLNDGPALFAATYRPEEIDRTHPIYALRRDLTQSGQLIEIDLESLSPGQVTTLITQLLGTVANGLPLSRRLFDETQGNPFYLVEVVRTLFEAGVIWIDASGQRRTHYDEIAERWQEFVLPATVREVILDRVARLERDQRDWLAAAAVIGRPFDFNLLEAVTGANSEILLAAVETFEGRHLLREQKDGRFDFDHDRIREVLYDELNAVRRRRLHARVAEGLERLGLGTPEDLARHYLRAEVWDKALAYHVEAGRRAADRYIYDQALELYRVAQELADRLDDRATLATILIDVGSIYFLSRSEAAIQALQEALIVGQGLLNRAQQARAVFYLGKLFEWRVDFAAALRYLRTCEHFLETTPDHEISEDIIWVYDLIGWLHRRRGNYEAALHHAQRGLDLIRQRSLDPELKQVAIARLENTLGMTCWSLGEPHRALDHLEHCQAICRAIERFHEFADATFNIGTILYHLGEFDRALEHLEEGRRHFERIGDVHGLAITCNNTGLVHYARQAYDQALESFQETLRLCQETGATWYQPETFSMLALSHLALDQFEDALHWASQALETARKLGSQTYRGFAHRALGECYARLAGGREQAVEHFERSIELLEDAGAHFDLALSYRAYGRVLHGWGQTEQGDHCLRQAQEIFQRLGCGRAWLEDEAVLEIWPA
jgi:tetratricopeptide (TPR) repeat protein